MIGGPPPSYGVPMTTVQPIQITFDCASPERVGRFWCEALGYVPPDVTEDGFATWEEYSLSLPEAERDSWFAASDPTGVGPRLFFQRVPEGKVVKNRVHLDVKVGRGFVGEERLAVLESHAARLEAIGATRGVLLLADEENESCQNMQDVEGNEFCLD